MADYAEVYRCYDANGSPLYIGQASRAGRRLMAHSGKHWWSDVARIIIDRHPSKEEAVKAEAKAIADENPRWNRYLVEPLAPIKNALPYRPDDAARRRHHAIWTDGTRSERDRLAAIAADYGAPVTRQTLNGRYGNPSNPKQLPE